MVFVREVDEDLVDLDVSIAFDDGHSSEEEKNEPEAWSEDFSNKQLEEVEIDLKKRNKHQENDDWYLSELEKIEQEELEDQIRREKLQKQIDEEKKLLKVAEQEEQVNDNCYIQQWLTLKWFINPQWFIEERGEWKNFLEFLQSSKHTKKSLEVLFYANTLTSFLWENYLDHYLFEDILAVYKNIAKDKDFFELLFKAKSNKKVIIYFKKYILNALKFVKIKRTKKPITKKAKEQQSLFGWFDLSLDDFNSFDDASEDINTTIIDLQTTLDTLKKELYQESSQKNPKSIKEFLVENMNKVLWDDEIKLNLTKLTSLKAQCDLLTYKCFFENLSKDKYPDNSKYVKITTDKDWNILQEWNQVLNDEVEKEYSEEVSSIFYSTQTSFLPKNLTYVQRNYNIQKYLDTVWFMDNKVWEHLKKEFDVKNVSRVRELSKYISWNENQKIEVFQKIIKNNVDFEVLKNQVFHQNKIIGLRLQTKKILMQLNVEDVIKVVLLVLNNKTRNNDNLITSINPGLADVVRVAHLCNINNDNWISRAIVRLRKTVAICAEHINKNDEQKRNIFIDDIKANDKWEYEKIALVFSSKVKSILITLFINSINDYLYEDKKSEIYQKHFQIRTFWYVTWKTLFEKNKVLLYLREKWEYAASVYGMWSQLFNKLKGLWVLTMSINWKGEERIDSVQYKTLGEKTLQDFEDTLIELKDLKAFKNFKKKILLFAPYLYWDDFKLFQNTFKNLDWKNTFLFFKYDFDEQETNKLRQQGNYIKDAYTFFFSDGEISVKMSQDEFLHISRNAKYWEDKDFVNTTFIDEQKWVTHPQFNTQMYQTTVNWLNENWDRQKNKVYTNLRCNVWFGKSDNTIKDPFENGVHKGILAYYFLYYHNLFNPRSKKIEINWKQYKGLIVYDLETIWFTGNIILSYFLYIGYETVIMQRYSHPEFWDFFEKMADGDYMINPDPNIPNDDPRKRISNVWASLENKVHTWTTSWDYLISWHNTLNFDNKKIAEDITQEKMLQSTIKQSLDNISIDVLAVLMQAWYWRLGLDFLSKINFDFGKNIKKGANEDLMTTILKIQDIIKMPEGEIKERTIKNKANYWMIHKFIAYNKNDVLMSMWLLGQLLQYWMLATGKRLAHITPEQLTISIK